MPDEKGRVTEEEANEALMQLVQQSAENPDEDAAVAEHSQAAEPETTVEPAEETAPAGATPAEPETDDVASLKKRLEEFEAKSAERESQFESRLKAFHERATYNERLLHDRLLRKSTTADKALKVLRATRSETGVPEAEVDAMIREIEGTMNPQSASYSPPPQPVAEDQAIVLNNFLNEKGMTSEEAGSFGHWIQTQGPTKLSIMEQAVASHSMDGFLRLAHIRWQESLRETQQQVTRNDTVEAVKTVQRTQREAARAASSAPTAPKKQPAKAPSQKKSWKDYSQDEIARLIQESVEQYH